MAKQTSPGTREQLITANEAEEIFRKHPDLQAFAKLMMAVIDARTEPLERLDHLIIPVQTIGGEEIHVSVPALANPIVKLSDPRLETFRNIVRLSVAHAPTIYRLGSSAPVQAGTAGQVTTVV